MLGSLDARHAGNDGYAGHAGGVDRPGPKSSSADLFIKHPTLTIEVQNKSGVSTGVSFANVCQEVGKCIQQGSVLWVLVALKLKESLSRWAGEARPLVLESGIYQEEELADAGSGGLLYGSKSKGRWQKRIQNGTTSHQRHNQKAKEKSFECDRSCKW